MNTENIKKKTNQMIGYEKWEREEKKKMKKIRNITLSLGIVTIFLISGFTVNAMTDNGIVNGIKEAMNLKVKVNGEEKNATCKTLDNGNIKCTMDKEVLGSEDSEFDIEYNPEYQGKLELETEIHNDTVKMKTIIKE